MNLLLVSWGSAIIDAVALILILLYFISGLKRGFIKTFFSTFGAIFSFLLAVLLCSTVANFLEKNYGTVSSVANWLSGGLNGIFGKDLMDTTLAQATQSDMSSGGVASWIISLVLSLKSSANIPTDVTLSQVISPVLAFYIVCAISLLALYIIFRIIFFLFGELAQKLHKFKPTALIDKLLGAVFGLIKGIVILDIAIIVINAIPLGFVQSIAIEIENTAITSFISNTNLIGMLFDFLFNNGVTQFIGNLF